MRSRGQATIEYTAILLVVAALLAVGGLAVPGVGERVLAAVRVGVCIAGGDVCRSSDASAAGLEPCVTRARSARAETVVEIAIVRLGEHGEWELALESDGGAVVSRLEEAEAGVTAGVGFTFSPARIEAGVSAASVGGYRSGRAWRFADARAAVAFLDSAAPERRPDMTWRALGGHVEGWAGVAAGELADAGIELDVASALGVRTEGARRTVTLDLGLERPHFAADLPGFAATPGAVRALVAELTWERGALRELRLRTASGGDGRLEEISGRLDLRDPESRAAAARLLRAGPGALRDVSALIASHGVVELSGYSVRERRSGFSAGGRLGGALGLARHRISSERRLTDAVAWVRGGPAQRRFDCLGV